MISFLRRRYVIVALTWWICSVAAIFVLGRVGNSLSLILTLNPVIVPAILLATRGFRQTTPVRVFLYTYAVALVPIGVFLFYGDVMDNAAHGWTNRHWTNTWVWFQLVFGGVLLTLPFVIGFSFIVAYINNLFMRDVDAE